MLGRNSIRILLYLQELPLGGAPEILIGKAAFLLNLYFFSFRKLVIHYDKFCRDILKRAFHSEIIYRLPETVSWRCS